MNTFSKTGSRGEFSRRKKIRLSRSAENDIYSGRCFSTECNLPTTTEDARERRGARTAPRAGARERKDGETHHTRLLGVDASSPRFASKRVNARSRARSWFTCRPRAPQRLCPCSSTTTPRPTRGTARRAPGRLAAVARRASYSSQQVRRPAALDSLVSRRRARHRRRPARAAPRGVSSPETPDFSPPRAKSSVDAQRAPR